MDIFFKKKLLVLGCKVFLLSASLTPAAVLASPDAVLELEKNTKELEQSIDDFLRVSEALADASRNKRKLSNSEIDVYIQKLDKIIGSDPDVLASSSVLKKMDKPDMLKVLVQPTEKFEMEEFTNKAPIKKNGLDSRRSTTQKKYDHEDLSKASDKQKKSLVKSEYIALDRHKKPSVIDKYSPSQYEVIATDLLDYISTMSREKAKKRSEELLSENYYNKNFTNLIFEGNFNHNNKLYLFFDEFRAEYENFLNLNFALIAMSNKLENPYVRNEIFEKFFEINVNNKYCYYMRVLFNGVTVNVNDLRVMSFTYYVNKMINDNFILTDLGGLSLLDLDEMNIEKSRHIDFIEKEIYETFIFNLRRCSSFGSLVFDRDMKIEDISFSEKHSSINSIFCESNKKDIYYINIKKK